MAERMSDEEKRRIIELYETRRDGQWLTYSQIATQVGRSYSAVIAVVKQAGITRSRTRVLSAADQDRLVAVYRAAQDAGTPVTMLELALQFGSYEHVVRRVLERAGHVIVSTKARDRRDLHDPEEAKHAEYLDALVLDLYRQGRSLREVSDLTGCAEDLVHELATEAGVLRSPSDSTRLFNSRRVHRTNLARMDLRPQAARWIRGAEIEELAAEVGVPADLMWDALADTMTNWPLPSGGPG